MKDQLLLDLISSTFSSTLQYPLLPEHLQSLKKHLYHRSFADAFPTSNTTKDEQDAAEDQNTLLEAYVVRWVPTRALCYSRIIQQVAKYLSNSELRVVCIGAGCGSETLALQSALTYERMRSWICSEIVNIDVVDSCPGWEPILSRITESANKTSITSATVNFHHGDIVTEYSNFKELFAIANLVTLMFTLNELITAQGKVPATKFLVELLKALPKGSLILVLTALDDADVDRWFSHIFCRWSCREALPGIVLSRPTSWPGEGMGSGKWMV